MAGSALHKKRKGKKKKMKGYARGGLVSGKTGIKKPTMTHGTMTGAGAATRGTKFRNDM